MTGVDSNEGIMRDSLGPRAGTMLTHAKFGCGSLICRRRRTHLSNANEVRMYCVPCTAAPSLLGWPSTNELG